MNLYRVSCNVLRKNKCLSYFLGYDIVIATSTLFSEIVFTHNETTLHLAQLKAP